MRKLPVGEVAAYSFGFGWRAIPALFRMGWLQIALFIAGAILVDLGGGETEIGTRMEGGADRFEISTGWSTTVQTIEEPLLFWPGLLIVFAALILLLPVYTRLIRLAAGEGEVPTGLALRLTGREWRVLGAALLTFLIFGVAVAVAALPLAFVGPMADRDAGGGAVIAVLFLGLAGMILAFWFYIRFSLFMPYTALENRIAPRAAFGVTRGNFWRLFGLYLIIVLIFFAITFGLWAIQVMLGALAAVFGSPIGTGDGSAFHLIFLGLLFAFQAAVQIYSNLVSTAASGRSAGYLTEGQPA